jgi:hypothetical protein
MVLKLGDTSESISEIPGKFKNVEKISWTDCVRNEKHHTESRRRGIS